MNKGVDCFKFDAGDTCQLRFDDRSLLYLMSFIMDNVFDRKKLSPKNREMGEELMISLTSIWMFGILLCLDCTSCIQNWNDGVNKAQFKCTFIVSWQTCMHTNWNTIPFLYLSQPNSRIWSQLSCLAFRKFSQFFFSLCSVYFIQKNLNNRFIYWTLAWTSVTATIKSITIAFHFLPIIT